MCCLSVSMVRRPSLLVLQCQSKEEKTMIDGALQHRVRRFICHRSQSWENEVHYSLPMKRHRALKILILSDRN